MTLYASDTETARLISLACFPPNPDSAESLDSKFMKSTLQHSALPERGGGFGRCMWCQVVPSLCSLSFFRFPLTAHINTLLQCGGSGTAVAPALRCASSLVWLESSTVTDTSQDSARSLGTSSQRGICMNFIILHHTPLWPLCYSTLLSEMQSEREELAQTSHPSGYSNI